MLTEGYSVNLGLNPQNGEVVWFVPLVKSSTLSVSTYNTTSLFVVFVITCFIVGLLLFLLLNDE